MLVRGTSSGSGNTKKGILNTIKKDINTVKNNYNKPNYSNTQIQTTAKQNIKITTANTKETYQFPNTSKIKNIKNELNKVTTNTKNNATKRIVDKIPTGVGINAATSELNVILPYKYAKTYGKDVTSLSQVLPNRLTNAKIVNNFASTKVGGKMSGIINETYINSVKTTNQFYNGGSYILKESTFGTQALSKTAATIAPKTIVKSIASVGTITGAAGGGAIETIMTAKDKYWDKGGLEEVEKHKGELGGRFIGATAGNIIGIGAGTTISAIIGGAATGAAVGSVVPVVGNIVGALGGCVIGAVASTLIGDATAEIGANLFDGENK